MPPFDTVLNLADYPDLRKSSLRGSIEGVLLILLELGTLLMYLQLQQYFSALRLVLD